MNNQEENNSYKVSVIVPVYNVEKYIFDCISSIQNQTIKNIEIIVVDDGTKDKSIQVIEKLIRADKRIKVIHQENKGLSGARNTGISASKGKYLSFVDSDDVIASTFLEEMYLEAEKNSLDIVRSSFRDFEGKIPKGWRPDTGDNNVILGGPVALSSFLDYKTSFVVWSSLYKRSFIEKKALAFEEGILLEDGDFMCNALLSANKVMFIDSCNYHYRVRPNSILTTNNVQKMSDSEKIVIAKFLKNYHLEENNNRKKLMLQSIYSFMKDWTRIVSQNKVIVDKAFIAMVYHEVWPVLRKRPLDERLKMMIKMLRIKFRKAN